MIALSLAAFLVGAMGLWSAPTGVERKPARHARLDDSLSALVNRHLTDTHMKHQLMKRKFELENRVTAPRKLGMDAETMPDDNHNYGVQLDSDDSAERLYEELNAEHNEYGDNLEEKINQRLANRKWLNEMEKAERLTFIKNFIRTAYDRGYEVQLDSNLVVTGVKRIHHPKQVNIEQVLERIAKQGN
jgi:hypothetical protein